MEWAHCPCLGRWEEVTERQVQRRLGNLHRAPPGKKQVWTQGLPNPHPPPQTHSFVLGGHFLGHGIQRSSGLGVDLAWGNHHHPALFGWELGKDVTFEAPQHDRFLQQELQLS